MLWIKETLSVPTNGLGAALRFWRERAGLTLRGVSDPAGIDHAYLYRLETGVKHRPSEDVILRLCEALELDERESKMLQLLGDYPDSSLAMVERALRDGSPWPHFYGAVKAQERDRWAA